MRVLAILLACCLAASPAWAASSWDATTMPRAPVAGWARATALVARHASATPMATVQLRSPCIVGHPTIRNRASRRG